jgi:hypothetical protein
MPIAIGNFAEYTYVRNSSAHRFEGAAAWRLLRMAGLGRHDFAIHHSHWAA